MFKRIIQRWVYLASLTISCTDSACASHRSRWLARITRHTHTPQKVACASLLRHTTSRRVRYLFYAYGLLLCMTYRHKLHYEDLGSQRWYFQPLRYSIPQGTRTPAFRLGFVMTAEWALALTEGMAFVKTMVHA